MYKRQGLVYRLAPLDDADKAAALRAHAAARGLPIADDLVAHLLRHRPRNLGLLVALLDALDGYALAQQRPLTIPLLRQWESQAAAGAPSPPPAPEAGAT